MATAQDPSGKPLLFRIRQRAPAFANQDDFTRLLTVSWAYESDDSGMPPEEVSERMQTLEDLLIAPIEIEQQGFLAVVATGNNVRDWLWYIRDRQTIANIVNVALGNEEPFPIELNVEEDPMWETYRNFLSIE